MVGDKDWETVFSRKALSKWNMLACGSLLTVIHYLTITWMLTITIVKCYNNNNNNNNNVYLIKRPY